MVKVCHFTSVHQATDGRIFEKECCSLAKAGYEVYLVAPNAKTEIKNGVHIVGVAMSNRGRLYRILCGTRMIYKKALSLNADIYHFHAPELLCFALDLKLKGKKVIFDSHEYYGYQIKEKKYLSKFLMNVVAAVYIHVETFICKRIDAVVQVCTINGVNYFENKSKKNIFITNVPKLSILSFKVEKSVASRNVVYVGGLTYNRGVTYLVEAVGKSKADLILAGKMTDDYATVIRQVKGFEKVHFEGQVSQEKVYALLNTAFVGASTLLKVGQYGRLDVLPTKIYEYMAMGLPVIMSNTVYNVEINNLEHFGICVEPTNISEVTEAIDFLLFNPEIAKKMGENGRKLIEKKYNWEIEERKLLNLYSSL